ncbi:MAG: type II toxin-antitoxin system PemK/MazF family toxin [Nocardioides sp.]
MLTSGEIVLLDLGVPQGHEAGFSRPTVVVTANDVLAEEAPIVHVVPLTSTIRHYTAEVLIDADGTNGLDADSAAQCQHIRSVAASRLGPTTGSISPVQLRQIRETLGLLLDL